MSILLGGAQLCAQWQMHARVGLPVASGGCLSRCTGGGTPAVSSRPCWRLPSPPLAGSLRLPLFLRSHGACTVPSFSPVPQSMRRLLKIIYCLLRWAPLRKVWGSWGERQAHRGSFQSWEWWCALLDVAVVLGTQELPQAQVGSAECYIIPSLQGTLWFGLKDSIVCVTQTLFKVKWLVQMGVMWLICCSICTPKIEFLSG